MRLTRSLMLVSFILVISVFGCSRKADEIRIGAVLPLTGDIATYGVKMKMGIDLAVKQIDGSGGIAGKHITVLYEDDQGDPKTSVAAVRKLIATKKVFVIIGGAISATALPSVPVVESHKVVLFSPAATTPKLSGVSEYFFRNWPSDIYDGTAMGEFAINELKLRRAAILYVNNEWGVAISKVFAESFKKGGGEILATESYEQNATDFRTQLTKIAANKPEAIYMPGYQKELMNALRQKTELGIRARVLSAYGFYDPQILELAGSAAEGAIFTAAAYDPDSKNPVVADYVGKFQMEYGEKPDIWSAQAYDAMEIIAVALRNGAKTGPEIRKEIANIKNFEGVAGLTSFDEKSDVQKPLRFMMVKDGQFVNYALDRDVRLP